MHFDDFSLDSRLAAGVRDAGYVIPTPIQQQAMPAALEGRDVLGLAQTGTGKTAAFVLPILQRLLRGRRNRRARALVLAPTRELALQIQADIALLGGHSGLKSVAVFGGVSQYPQVQGLRRADIVVACPGRLLDLMNQGLADLSGVEILVLDEADRMFDMGFLPDLRKIMSRLPETRQNLLFSATMPGEIRGLADTLLQDPAVVQAAHNAPAASISQAAYRVPSRLKANMLEALLRELSFQSVLVFTRTKHRAKSLAQKLERSGYKAASLQGNLSQNKRVEAMDGFRRGRYQILVATDIAARGIDCDRISHVINFDVPDTAEAYTHRIGRTGRADRSGSALTLVAGEEAGAMRAIERQLGLNIEKLILEGFDATEDPRPFDSREPRPGQGRRPSKPREGDERPRKPRTEGRQAKGPVGNKPARPTDSRKAKPARPDKGADEARDARAPRKARPGNGPKAKPRASENNSGDRPLQRGRRERSDRPWEAMAG